MRKIIAVDIDGTLVDNKKNLSEITKNSLIKAQEIGHVVVIATGRHPKGVEHYAKALEFDRFGGLLSNFNGAYVGNFKSGEALVDHKIDQDLLEDYISLSKTLPVHHVIYKNNKIYTDSKDSIFTNLTARMNRMDHVYQADLLDKVDFSLNNVVLGHEDPDVLDNVEEKIRARFDSLLNIVRSTPNFLEAMPLGINKGTSLIEIANYYDLDIEDVIAFGDELNDVEMIKTAGIGVAMANANPVIKDLADYVTLSNEDNGIVDYLEKFNII